MDKYWKSAIWNCRTYQGTDVSLDHSLLMCNFKYRLKKNKKKQPSIRYVVDSLQREDLQDSFQRKLKIQLQEKVANLPPDCNVKIHAEKLSCFDDNN